jgi:flagellar FliL protein
MADEKEQQAPEEQQEGGKKKLIILLLLILLVIALIAGGTAFYFLKFKKKKQPPKVVNATNGTVIKQPQLPQELKKLEKPGIFVPIGNFIVNLADTDVQRYVKVSITIEVINQKVQNEIQQYMPAIKDVIINILSSKYYKDIKTPEGREKLKIEMLKKINSLLPNGGVKAIYFTDFVIQTM